MRIWEIAAPKGSMNDQRCFYCKTEIPDHHPTCPMIEIDTWPEDEQTIIWEFDPFARIHWELAQLLRLGEERVRVSK